MLSARIQRMMMGTMLMVVLYLMNTQEIMVATYLLGFVTALVFIWGLFDFCPSLWILEKTVDKKKV